MRWNPVARSKIQSTYPDRNDRAWCVLTTRCDATRLDIENQLRESHGRPLLASLDELFAQTSVSSPDENNVEQSEPPETGRYAPEEGVHAVSLADETEFEDPFVTEAMRLLADYEALSKRVLALRDEED